MLTIRFARVGKKNKAQFKILLQESQTAPGGRHVEVLGSYDPHQKNAIIKEERVKFWLERGAQASDTVHNLLVSKGIIQDKKRTVKLPKKEVPVVSEEAAPAAEVKEASASAPAPTEEIKELADAPAVADKEVKSE
jgi:small subunit ribosomal protein S16